MIQLQFVLMSRPILVPLGGFLGAGKTTLILTAARMLQARGVRTAAILNDQGSELADTRFVTASGLDADQVLGGCFCCRFSELLEAAERLWVYSPDVIFAEAVGSCTDISATTLQPLKLHHSQQFRLAPYTVLVDPERARALAEDGASDISWLFEKQIAEADLICFTKTDLHNEFPELSGAPVRHLSGVTGEGVAPWLDEILSGELPSGNRILEIDYQRYARAEACLAWLNCRLQVTVDTPLSPAAVVGPLLDGLDAELTRVGMGIAHLKLMDETASGYVKASIVRNGQEPRVEGMLDASPAVGHELVLNVRATGTPKMLEASVRRQVARLPGKVEVLALACFSPSPPNPEMRLDTVVAGTWE